MCNYYFILRTSSYHSFLPPGAFRIDMLRYGLFGFHDTGTERDLRGMPTHSVLYSYDKGISCLHLTLMIKDALRAIQVPTSVSHLLYTMKLLAVLPELLVLIKCHCSEKQPEPKQRPNIKLNWNNEIYRACAIFYLHFSGRKNNNTYAFSANMAPISVNRVWQVWGR